MKYIKLTQGKRTMVDNEDFIWLNKLKWCAHQTRGGLWTAESTINGKLEKMHRIILGAAKGQEVDHANRNGLDNRRRNIRICTRRENLLNRGLFKNKKTSKYKGVYRSRSGSYVSLGFLNNKTYYLGVSKTQLEAYRKYLDFRNSAEAELSTRQTN